MGSGSALGACEQTRPGNLRGFKLDPAYVDVSKETWWHKGIITGSEEEQKATRIGARKERIVHD